MKFWAYVRMLRPHQWAKNAFVVAPLFFSLRLQEPGALRNTALALLAFVLTSCAVYVFNDLRDIEADRAHSVKRHRPLASRAVPVGGAWLLGAVLVGLVLVLLPLSGLGRGFAATLAVYVAVNVTYSLGLKQVPLLEMAMVASGFVVRLVAGCLAIGVEPTNWIVLNTALISLLLVAGKRRSDVVAQQAVHRHNAVLKAYSPGALDLMMSVLASGTVMTYILFTVSAHAISHFGAPYLYISSAFVILGVLRYVQLAHDGQGTDDPSTLAVRDPLLRYCVLAWLITLYVLIY
ncbi:MAG: decaprenyl-phosphate phosphoribosyltransferase [Candidatus Lambdaproteobacteria bacterium]|nr:decaprenyl-phosphate phosphoribosyltransferase [Candidatus Lambdaproteobacteria bacterium]